MFVFTLFWKHAHHSSLTTCHCDLICCRGKRAAGKGRGGKAAKTAKQVAEEENALEVHLR